ncbi:MAG: tRNA preQ1(34) S-adenosylmethionine ribosyltransferase-isomerase QueA [Oscillospiraceae bacterium]|nr:tRNA preQ1(34) S-adenosylmethionine ribosyltransferase-isomerase QueA [Oscillospiraceae bacterium]
MNTSDFWYDLPDNFIAQSPAEPRDHSRLLYYNKYTQEVYHKRFYDIIDFLDSGDVLVLNNSRVLPARLYGKRSDSGADVEILLLEQKNSSVWEILTKPGRKATTGTEIIFADGLLRLKIAEVLKNGNRLAEFYYNDSFYDILENIGQMPLPHYIKKILQDKERYQTVYSKNLGSVAAPTAGLHFTRELLQRLEDKGVKLAYITLHVGLGTFRPVRAESIEEHKMHAEHYFISRESAEVINAAKKSGGRVVSVGTTSCRTLESAADENGIVREAEGYTDIFIYPGYKFKILDGLITNFHLPESTLIMLVSAFAGCEKTRRLYKIAIEEKYRFYSFGDAMIIL